MTTEFPDPSTGFADLSGSTALVTGAGSGIGFACAKRLAAAGCLVHVLDHDERAATAAANEIDGRTHVLDLREDSGVTRLPTEVDILVNNAGIQHVAPIQEFPTDVFTQIQQVMVTAPFLLMRHCLPHMYERGWGRIVNISSVHGVRASAGKSAYVAAKHALEGLNKVAALEGGPHGVTSNCVEPGYVRTPLLEGQLAAQARENGIPEHEVADRVFLRHSAIKRLIEPDEVATVVGWLCGPGSDYLTGASIPIDGAWTAR